MKDNMPASISPEPRVIFENLTPLPQVPCFVLKTEHRSGDNVFHSHDDFYELVVIRKGDGLHTISQHLPTRIFSGRVLLVPPGSAHSYSHYTSISLINYIFTPSFLESIHDQIKDIPGYQLLFERDDAQEESLSPLVLENQHLVELTVLVDEMMSEQLSPSPGFALLLKAQFVVSLICILRNIQNKASNSTGALRLLGLLDFLQAHYAKKLSLSQMAGMTNMSVASLCRHFQDEVGCSPLEFLLRTRIEKSKQLLASSSLSLAEISASCGFNDVNYFSRQFTRRVGIPPTDWRSRPHGINYMSNDQNNFSYLSTP